MRWHSPGGRCARSATSPRRRCCTSCATRSRRARRTVRAGACCWRWAPDSVASWYYSDGERSEPEDTGSVHGVAERQRGDAVSAVQYSFLVGLVAVGRLGELVVAKRNLAWSRAREIG